MEEQVVPPKDDLFEKHFGFSPDWATDGILRTMRSNMITMLSEYTGYSESDLNVHWPDDA
jgi:hypothetical protein